MAVHAVPSTAIPSPMRARRDRIAYQTPSAATVRPMSSPVEHGKDRDDGESAQPMLVEKPDPVEQQGDGQCHGVDVVDGVPDEPREDEVPGGEETGGDGGADVLHRESHDWIDPRGKRSGLEHDHRLGVRDGSTRKARRARERDRNGRRGA